VDSRAGVVGGGEGGHFDILGCWSRGAEGARRFGAEDGEAGAGLPEGVAGGAGVKGWWWGREGGDLLGGMWGSAGAVEVEEEGEEGGEEGVEDVEAGEGGDSWVVQG